MADTPAMTRTAYRTCPLCEALCGLELTVRDDRVTRVRGDVADPLSQGFICPKGAALGRLDGDPDRLDGPLVRSGGRHVPVSWDEAFAVTFQRLHAITDARGKDAVGVFIGNPSVHSLATPFYGSTLIKALGTRNIFTASTTDQMPKHVSSGYMFGDPMAIAVPDLERSDYLLMLGANPLDSNGSLCSAPGFPRRLKAISARGKVTVVDPRRTRTAELADQHVFIRPGTDAYFLFALVHTLFAEDLVSLGGLADRVRGLDDLRALAVDFSPEMVAQATGIRPLVTRRLARELAAAPRAAVYGRIGTCTQAFGTLASWLVDVLNVLTGNLDRPGGALFPRPAHVPVYSRRRPFTTGRWRSRVRGLPEVNGELPVATLADEMETPGDGRIRAMVTIAGNPVLSAPNGERLDRAFGGLDFMVSVDPYLNETTRHADVILPPPRPTQSPHYDLVLLNFAIRDYARYSPPALPLPPDRPTEAEILARLAALGADPAQLDEHLISTALKKAVTAPGSPVYGRDPAQLLKELTASDTRPGRPPSGAELRLDMLLRLGPYGEGFGADPSGLTLARLRDEHPHGVDLGPLTPRLDEVLCTASGRIELCPPPFEADADRLRAGLATAPGPELVLIGRRHLRSNNSWMHNVPELVGGSNRCTLQLNPADAERLGVAAGAQVLIRSRAGTIEAMAEPTDQLMPGVASLPHGWGHDRPGTRTQVATAHPGVNANVLTDDQAIDPLSGNAVLNGVPITVEPLA